MKTQLVEKILPSVFEIFTLLGLQMKSVGEVMGIGRSFQEALQT